jgi:hypothetical protein
MAQKKLDFWTGSKQQEIALDFYNSFPFQTLMPRPALISTNISSFLANSR